MNTLKTQNRPIETSLKSPLEVLTESSSDLTSSVPTRQPSVALAEGSPEGPEVLERLETLDDVVFPAIDGDEQALAQVEPAWREAVAELGPEVVQESRNQYLRYARNTWEFLRRNSTGQRHRMLALLHVIALLSGIDM